MSRILLCLVLLGGSLLGAAEEGVWVALSVATTGDEGKAQESQFMGRISREDLTALREGRNRDGFIHVTGVCWRAGDGPGQVVRYPVDSPDETDEVYFRTNRIERIVVLKGDPHAVAGAPPATGKPTAPAAEGY